MVVVAAAAAGSVSFFFWLRAKRADAVVLPARFPVVSRTYKVGFRINLHESYAALMDEVIAEFSQAKPTEFSTMGTQGGYGCRLTKSAGKCGPLLSIHSYGFAADLTFNGYTDGQVRRRAQRARTLTQQDARRTTTASTPR